MAALGWQSHQRLDSTVAINSPSERARILVGEGAGFVFLELMGKVAGVVFDWRVVQVQVDRKNSVVVFFAFFAFV